MSDARGQVGTERTPEAAPPPRRRLPDHASRGVHDDLRAGLVLVAVMAVAGALLGLVWAWWSPPGPLAQVLGHGSFIPDETEAFVAGDGRFLVIAAAAGLLAALAAWRLVHARGPMLALSLAVGGAAGALLMELVGHLAGGGSFHGKTYHYADGSTREFTRHLPLSLHMQGLLLVEPALAVLVFGMIVAFAVRDDLGRPDPVRAALFPARPQPADGEA